MAQSVSALWRNQLGKSAELVVRLEVLDTHRNIVASTDRGAVTPIAVKEVQVTVDRTRNIWATCQATVTAAYNPGDLPWWLVPATSTDPLSPISGGSLRVWAGFRYPDPVVTAGLANPELVPCGRFDIETVHVNHAAGGVEIELDGQDLTGRLDVADIPSPVDLAWGTSTLAAAQMLVLAAIPDLTFLADPSSETIPRVVLDQQANRLTEINRMMTSIGFEAFMDASGEFMRMRPIVTTADELVWELKAGQFTVLTEASNSLSRERVYNGVIVNGENLNSGDPPVHAEAWDTDPTSPTRYIVSGSTVDTQIGPRPYFMTSQYVRTTEQAQAAADAQLRKVKGLLQRVSASTVANPALNVGDVILVVDPAIGVNSRYVVERLSWSSNGGPMQVTCEERRV
jgi:hypothetical protein